MASTQSTTPAQTEAPTPTDNAPKGWIIVQQLVKEDAQLQVSVTNQHIFDTFTKHGFQMRIVNSRDIDIYLTNYERKSIVIKNVVTKLPDFVLSRTGISTNFATMAIYRHLERLGVPVLNKSEAVDSAKDKLYSLQILAQNKIPVPKTMLLRFPLNVEYVTKRLGVPIIIKCLSGQKVTNVFLAKTKDELQTYCDLLESVNPNIPMIFQEFLQHSFGRDVRVVVINGKVVGAMMRSNEHDFRANIHRGGVGSPFKLNNHAEYMALQTAKLLGLDFAVIDLLFDDAKGKKFRVSHCNSSPVLETFEKVTGLDVAGSLITMIRYKCGIAPPIELEEEDENGVEENAEETQ
mmetsp:Transcript_63222/g.100519  ORF Transcript_63222/g.100519 Transcript_63222/m.100519 type:complete len:348 (+) Transcript_63222:68-1111(+)